MTYVPRSPRRTTKLRAVVDDGGARSIGRVRDMSTSGLFVDTTGTAGNTALAVGRRVAVVTLVGDLDGERLPAEVARVGEKGVAIRFLGLDADHRQRLRQIMNGEENNLVAPRTRPHAALPMFKLPDDAPVVLITDEAAPVSEAAASGDSGDLAAQVEELEGQILEMSRDKTALLEENSRLKRQVVALTARNSLMMRAQDELLETQEALLEAERARDALIAEMQRLERTPRPL